MQSRSGSDFWPGEYQKTYVYAQRSYSGVLDGLRSGRIFAVAGDLITGLDVQVSAGQRVAGLGETLSVQKGQQAGLTVKFRDPDAKNTHGDNPRVARVDVIMGEIHGPSEDANGDRNQTTRVIARFVEKQWKRDGDTYTFTDLCRRPIAAFTSGSAARTPMTWSHRWMPSARAPGPTCGSTPTRSSWRSTRSNPPQRRKAGHSQSRPQRVQTL